MKQAAGTLQRILDGGVIAILRGVHPEGFIEAAAAIVAGGVEAVEFTLNTPQALQLIRLTRQRLGDKALVGAGTVLGAAQAQAALDAGAQFVVTPTLARGAFTTAKRRGVPAFIGAYTPTEVHTAWEWGADGVKLFPASAGGPAYLRALRGPLPQVRLLPTGGVDAHNAGDYIQAGAAAVAVGGRLAPQDQIAAREFHRLTEAARRLVAAVHQARGETTP